MTGKELIIYILINDLLDKPVIDGDKIIGFMTEEEAAIQYNVGNATIRAWVDCGILTGYSLGGKLFIADNQLSLLMEALK